MAESIQLKPGYRDKCPVGGWFILDELLNKVFLKTEPEFYKEIYKKYNEVTVLDGTYNERAQKLIWKNTDEKNG